MKISGSILASKGDYMDYARELQYAYIDYLHIDVFQNEGRFMLGDLLKFDSTYLPLDVHMIYESITEDDIALLNQANVRYCNVQYENLREKDLIYDMSKEFKGNLGIALTSKTHIDELDRYMDSISQVLFMCSEPGVSGAEFDESNFDRIARLHSKYPSLEIFADGGINDVIGEKMGRLGVTTVISGSYLCKGVSMLSSNLYRLRYLNEVNISVLRNMIKYSFLPVLSKEASFMDIVYTMNKFRLGIVLITQDEILEGIITDGDIRRGFISFSESVFNKTALELMNKTPYTIESDKTMEDIFCQLPKMRKGIDVIPIVENNKLLGAIDLRIAL